MDPEKDAFGQMVLAYHENPEAHVTEIIERDDDYIDVSLGPTLYFAAFEDWPAVEREAINHAHGRALDVGCGPGRVCLHLQERGLQVTGIDYSPGAIEVARLRGVADARLMSITTASRNTLGQMDTIVMLGNNWGLMASRRRARWLLRRFYNMTGPDGLIIAETRSPTGTDNPFHLAYHERNRQRGRLPGQVRLRNRYRTTIGPWFDYLFVSPEEMDDILEGTGWAVDDRLVDEDRGIYVAIIKKA